MTVKINDTLITSNDLQGQTTNYFDTDLKLLAPNSSDDKIKRLLSCDAEKQYLQYKATQSIPYDLTMTHNIQVVEQPADNTELYEYSLGSNKCKEFNLTFKVKNEAVTAGTKFLLEQPGLLSCKSQDNTLYFKIPEWDNAWKKVDPEVLKSNNTITLEAYNSGTGTNIPYYAYTNGNTTYYTQDDPPNDKTPESTWTQPTLSSNGTLGGSTFAVYCSTPLYSDWYVYKAFDNNNSTAWATTISSDIFPVELIIYNPIPLKVTSFSWQTYDSNRYPTEWEWYGSNDNTTYTLLDSGTNSSNDFILNFNPNNYYKYYKFKILAAPNYINAKQITLTGIEAEKSIIYNHTNNEFTPLNPQPEFTAHTEGLKNASVVGTLTENNGVYSGFGTSSKQYIISDNIFNFTADTWSIITKIKFYSAKSSWFLGSGFVGSESKFSILLGTDSSNHISALLSSGSGWDISSTTSSKTFNLNEYYYIKYYFTGTSYKVDLSTTGSFTGEEENFINVSSSTKVYNANNYIMFGANPYGGGAYQNLDGEIDIKETNYTCDSSITTFYSTFTGIQIGQTQYPRNTQGDLVDTVYFADRLKLTVNDAEYTLVDNLEDMPIIKTGVLAIREDLRR